MFRRRAGPPLLMLLLVGLLSTSIPSVAQTEEPSFPPGTWNGSVFLSGEMLTTGEGLEGADYKDVRTIKSSSIFFDIVVDRDGTVTEGTMTVDIRFSTVGTGNSPVTGTPYRVDGEHRQSGSLDLESDADLLIATGTLTTESFVYADGEFLEEVSGLQDHEVGWVFRASEVTCGMVSGKLVNAWGVGMMVSARLPEHGLVAVFRLLSAEEEERIQLILEDMEALEEAAAALLTEPGADIGALASLIVYAKAIQVNVAQLEQCKALPEGFLGSDGDGWLATILRQLISKALTDFEDLTATDIIQLLNIAVGGGAAMPSGGPDEAAALYEELGDALEFALGRAISADDTTSIQDIAAAAAQFGFPDLHDAAMAALEGEG